VTASRITGTDEQQIHQVIRDAGGRLTVSTRAVVTVLLDGSGHRSADDVIAEVNARTPGVAASTIYRVLQRLDELGIVEHVHSGHGPTFYHLREQGHAHLVCSECGRIIDIPGRILANVTQNVRRNYDFTIEPHHTALIGLCATCAQQG
jgi:Fur family ferric uptake transcriptional regulator